MYLMDKHQLWMIQSKFLISTSFGPFALHRHVEQLTFWSDVLVHTSQRYHTFPQLWSCMEGSWHTGFCSPQEVIVSVAQRMKNRWVKVVLDNRLNHREVDEDAITLLAGKPKTKPLPGQFQIKTLTHATHRAIFQVVCLFSLWNDH